MSIPRPVKLLLLALTLWPPLYGTWFIVNMATRIDTRNLGIVMLIHGLTAMLCVVLLVVYAIHLFKSDRVPRDRKALWGIALLLGIPVAMPVYWFAHVWPDARMAR